MELHLNFYFIENLANFLNSEAKLEQYLQEFPPVEGNVGRAKTRLAEPRKHLLDVLKGQSKVSLDIKKS